MGSIYILANKLKNVTNNNKSIKLFPQPFLNTNYRIFLNRSSVHACVIEIVDRSNYVIRNVHVSKVHVTKYTAEAVVKKVV